MSEEAKRLAIRRLTVRQLDAARALILDCALQDKAIASSLEMSQNTLKVHKRMVFAHLKVRSRFELIGEYHALFAEMRSAGW